MREVAQVWGLNELKPLQVRLLQINEWLGEEAIRFKPFELGEGTKTLE